MFSVFKSSCSETAYAGEMKLLHSILTAEILCAGRHFNRTTNEMRNVHRMKMFDLAGHSGEPGQSCRCRCYCGGCSCKGVESLCNSAWAELLAPAMIWCTKLYGCTGPETHRPREIKPCRRALVLDSST